MKPNAFLAPLVVAFAVGAHGAELGDEIERLTAEAEPGVVATRHDLHEHPELSNREERTARIVAERLEALGLEVPGPDSP